MQLAGQNPHRLKFTVPILTAPKHILRSNPSREEINPIRDPVNRIKDAKRLIHSAQRIPGVWKIYSGEILAQGRPKSALRFWRMKQRWDNPVTFQFPDMRAQEETNRAEGKLKVAYFNQI